MARATLSGLVNKVSGKVGSQVFYVVRGGVAVRPRPKYRQFPHPETAGARERLKQAAAAFKTLSLDEHARWAAYAETQVRHNRLTSEPYAPSSYNAFVGLATRFLQANPGSPVPTSPPVADFLGDSIRIVTAAIPGGVRFTATGPNAPGVVTELLYQPLAAAYRKPGKFYKELTVHAFEGDPAVLDVVLAPGYYVFAYRFIKSASGQSTDLALLSDVVQVDSMAMAA